MSASRSALVATFLALTTLTAAASAVGQTPASARTNVTRAAPAPRVPNPALAVARGASPLAGPSLATAAAPGVGGRVRAKRVDRPASPGALTTIAKANAQARDWPTPGAYVNSALYYDFEPGRLYTIHTSPRFLTTITLKPGEKLIAKAAGDTVRWVIGETQAGAGDSVQVVIFVKPIRPDLRTNIVLTTDQRTYLIDAVSNAGSAYTSVLSWNYPQDLAREAAARRDQAQTAASVRAATTAADAIPIDRLDFRYRIAPRKGRAPAWIPVRVFDDGVRTYIEFPADLATREAPPLFLLGDDGQAQLVNYRQKGLYYVVDRLIDRAELRLGDKPQAIVRITRLGGAR